MGRLCGMRGVVPPLPPSATLCELMRLSPPVSQEDNTALIGAAWGGHLPVVETLLGADADPNAKNNVRGWAPPVHGMGGAIVGGGGQACAH